ncbi:NlpC/P60 family protein [Clostridium transplantifaecale]|uniref:C40 family peptidase n=1 Tax=Clostridium transplantifaecale TaxID=2479838 RepID=UPI000F63F4E1|nr:C40 family peptidase [Clostridium transplantifaecale]
MKWGKGRFAETAVRSVILLLLFQMVFAGVIYATPITQTEKEKKKSQDRLDSVNQEIDTIQKNKDFATQQVSELEDKLTALLVTIQVLEEELEEKKVSLRAAEKAYDRAASDERDQYDAMKKRIRYVYEKGEPDYLDILLKSNSLSDALCENEYFRQLYEYDQNMILRYKEVRYHAEELKNRLEEEKAEMEVMEQEYLAEKKELQQTVSAKKAEISDFNEKLDKAKTDAALYAEDVRKQTEKLRIMRVEERERLKQQARNNGNRSGNGTFSGSQFNNSPAKGNTGKQIVKSTGGTAEGRAIADFALQFVGNPYVWGGTSLTNGADCSGFAQSVYKHFGISIPRTSAEQSQYGQKVAFDDLQPGDLVFYAGHVAISIGDGRIVHASSAKEGIKISDDVTYRTILGIRRPRG